jgi:hypothetical protein
MSSSSRSILRAAMRCAPTTAPRTCCTRRCATGWAGHVTQKGSMVAPIGCASTSRTTALSADEIAAIEAEVNAQIRRNSSGDHPADDARSGRRSRRDGAVWREIWRRSPRAQHGRCDGENYSVELCGGTHVNALGDIALLTIISEGAVSQRYPPDRSLDRRSRAAASGAARKPVEGHRVPAQNSAR